MRKTFKKIKDIKLQKSINPNIYVIDSIKTCDGHIFTGEEVSPNPDKTGESENAKWLSNLLNIDVYLMPEVKQTETVKKVKSYDYLLDNSMERWDCKAGLSSSSRRLFKNNMNFHQATSYLFDIHRCKKPDGSKITDDYVEDLIDYTFKTEKWVNYIIVKDRNRLIGIYQNVNK